MTNSAANCSGIALRPYTTIMLARKVTSTMTVRSSHGTGEHRLTSSATTEHSSTPASISLNLWRSGLGMSIRLVHSAPIATAIAVGRSLMASAGRVGVFTFGAGTLAIRIVKATAGPLTSIAWHMRGWTSPKVARVLMVPSKAEAIKMAVRREGTELPTTKGVL